MSALDELREALVSGWGSLIDYNATEIRDGINADLDAFEANACDGCRHWHGEPGSSATAPCTVKGSFRAPGGLFTERGFWCCHWTKP